MSNHDHHADHHADHSPGHQHGHQHGHVELGEAEWAAMAERTEAEGELTLEFVVEAARWIDALRAPTAPPVTRILDIGSGPGVAACELAARFPGAAVVAVDGSTAMLDRAARRATRAGLDHVSTLHAELPDGLAGIEPADVIWASMSLHHVGDEVGAIRALGDLLAPHGLLAIAEFGDEPTAYLPADLDVGRPGLHDRLRAAERTWFASMRAGLAGTVASSDLVAMVESAGLQVAGARQCMSRHDAPLGTAARTVILGRVQHARTQLADLLDADDLDALEVLADPDDDRGVMRRPDVFLATSRLLVMARRAQRDDR